MNYTPEVLAEQQRRLKNMIYNHDPEWKAYFEDQARRKRDYETITEAMRKYRIKINYKFLGLFKRSTEIIIEYYDMQSARVFALARFNKTHPFGFEPEIVSSIEFR